MYDVTPTLVLFELEFLCGKPFYILFPPCILDFNGDSKCFNECFQERFFVYMFVFISDKFFHGPEITAGLIAKAVEDNKAIKNTIPGKVP